MILGLNNNHAVIRNPRVAKIYNTLAQALGNIKTIQITAQLDRAIGFIDGLSTRTRRPYSRKFNGIWRDRQAPIYDKRIIHSN